MKAIYFDAFSGVSGDMFLGALLDLGVEIGKLREDLARLEVTGYHLHTSRRTAAGITGTKLEVCLGGEPGQWEDTDHGHTHVEDHGHGGHADVKLSFAPSVGHPHPHASEGFAPLPHVGSAPTAHGSGPHEPRDFRTIAALIERSSLSSWVRERAVSVFRRIAEAEAKIHGLSPEEVHFHEVGAVDSIVDIVAGCLALESLGRPRVFAAPLVEGKGWVRCAHGRFPVPAPATLEILAARGLTVSQCEEPQEMVTPTGAALLAELAEAFGPMPTLRLERIGYGLGTRRMVTRPNVLRAVLGELAPTPDSTKPAYDWDVDQVACLETNLDDTNPEVLGHFLERALAEGALDVFYGPVQMKKSRPGVILSVLCPVNEADRFAALVLAETSAFGVRRTIVERRKLRREFQTLDTPLGKVVVKVGRLQGRILQVAPEYESCRAVAAAAGVPVKVVYEAALRAFPTPPSAVR